MNKKYLSSCILIIMMINNCVCFVSIRHQYKYIKCMKEYHYLTACHKICLINETEYRNKLESYKKKCKLFFKKKK